VFESENFFRAVFFRDEKYSLKTGQKSAQKSTQKTSDMILGILAENPSATMAQMAEELCIHNSSVKKHVCNLKKQGRLKRIGPDKGGHWEIRSA
jgi:ATP-dependent DNA helicase RecG